MLRKPLLSFAFASIVALVPMTAKAGIPVIDVTAIANLVQQIGYWQQQIAGMTNQLNQLQQTHAAMTGTRGMQSLLPMSNLQRNYLPPDYAELMNTVNGHSATYAGLSMQIQSVMIANAVLSNAQLGAMTPEMRQIVESGRRSSAMMSALSQSAYQNTSQRFAALQQLITTIGAAGDTKAIQDLQGRVNSEQAMLQNEQIKLQTLYQMAQADQWAQQQRARERSISDVGSVNSLAPVPY
jgi:type IV secretion system protein VirB5